MKKFIKVLFYFVAALYPALVFALLVLLKVNVRILSLCVIVLAGAFFISATGVKNSGGERRKAAFDWRPMASSALFLAAGISCFLTENVIFLKLYSVAISLTLLFLFGSTLVFPPNICFRFASMMDKSIAASSFEGAVLRYTKKVTAVWCVFFILNGGVAAYTALHDFGSAELNDAVWSVYNGGISYVLIGLIFSIEFFIRRRVDAKMVKCFPFTKFKADSRRDDFVLCYENAWSDKKYKTWRDFLTDTAKLRAHIFASSAQDWILHCEDYWYFLVAFVALLQCRRRILLTQNISEAFIAEIKADGTAFLTDRQDAAGAENVAPILAAAPFPPQEALRSVPEIDSDATQILMYTSGSTGSPKAVLQRMTEFEADNAFIISKWADEFTSRKLVATVSQHHIYGFLFGVSLPFTLGVPFRRTRIIYPEEFLRLSDERYMIIATPAFLKRSVEIEGRLPLRNPWIFTSGGACSPELAEKTQDVFGFCPLEVYGSTETSGIAYRQQSKDGLKYTPFDNAKVWLGDDGCLRIISPYIKNPEGFATSDLAELLADGKFLLKGRSDSIVKIEEKRISMTEVENRLLQSNLVADVKVVFLSNEVRQYLAAAVVLNDSGRAQFAGQEKHQINRWFHDFLLQWFENVVVPKRWRYLDFLPVDAQGKKHRVEIEALFSAP